MDISEAVTLELPCSVCGGRFAISLAHMRFGAQLIHECCRDRQEERTCLPLVAKGLLDEQTIAALVDAWQRLEARAQGLGGRLAIRSS